MFSRWLVVVSIVVTSVGFADPLMSSSERRTLMRDKGLENIGSEMPSGQGSIHVALNSVQAGAKEGKYFVSLGLSCSKTARQIHSHTGISTLQGTERYMGDSYFYSHVIGLTASQQVTARPTVADLHVSLSEIRQSLLWANANVEKCTPEFFVCLGRSSWSPAGKVVQCTSPIPMRDVTKLQQKSRTASLGNKTTGESAEIEISTQLD